MLTLTASPLPAAATAASARQRRSTTPWAPTTSSMTSLASSRPDRAPARRSSSSRRRTLPALAFGGDDGGAAAAAAAVASPSEEEEEEEEEEAAAAAPLSPLVIVVPFETPRNSSSSSSSSSGSSSGKAEKGRLGLFVASAALAHPAKAHYGGEDAWFSSPRSGSVGVADGVGGWAESGVCPAEYARELMAAARSAAEGVEPARVTLESLAAARRRAALATVGESGPSPPPPSAPGGDASSSPGVPIACFEAAGGGAPAPPSPSPSPAPSSSYGEDGDAPPLEALLPPPPLSPSEIPRRALAAAHAAVRLPGSATACVAALDPDSGTLHGVSVGDAALLVARKGSAIIFRSSPSSHSFDCPRQLAAAPEHVEWSDGVEDGEAFEVEGLEEGDVVILGTDGVFDNCWAAELLALLPAEAPRASDGDGGGDGGDGGDGGAPSSSSSAPCSLSLCAKAIAEKIVLLASANSRDESYPSPYAAEAAACGVDLRGGGVGGKNERDALGDAVSSLSSFASRLFGGGASSSSDGEDDDAGGAALLGGKLDDITVVVAVVGRFCEDADFVS